MDISPESQFAGQQGIRAYGGDLRHVVEVGGRRLDVVEHGARDAPVLLFQHGSPGAAEEYAPWVEAALTRGFRWVSFSRAGNGGSDRRAGRTVADNCDDVETVLNACDARRFVTIGWSGGGPHALACAAVLPDRCWGAVTMGGLGPVTMLAEAGHDPTAGMDATNVGLFDAAQAGEQQLRATMAPFVAQMPTLDGSTVSAMLGGLLCEADRAVMSGEFADDVAAGYREATRVTPDGWVDDFLAVTGDWGFTLSAIAVPVAIWQGGQDRMVPPLHGSFLVEHVPGVRPHLLPEDGHLSIAIGRFDEILAEAMSFVTSDTRHR
jgi:pimeloyl-ACP methyl ester carboxylesterase